MCVQVIGAGLRLQNPQSNYLLLVISTEGFDSLMVSEQGRSGGAATAGDRSEKTGGIVIDEDHIEVSNDGSWLVV